MLQLRPNCEACDKDLPPDALDACICSYEYTFCRDCVDNLLQNVCPNCGGGFTSRPIRPSTERRPSTSLANQPASQKRVHTRYSKQEIQTFIEPVKGIPPQER